MQTKEEIYQIIDRERKRTENMNIKVSDVVGKEINNYGYITIYMHIEKGHFNTTLKKKDGTEYFKYKRIEITKILKQFPIITYYQPAKNVMNYKDHVFGVSAATFTSILPYVYDEQKEALSKEEFDSLKYITVNEMKAILRNIIDFVVEYHKPQEIQTMTCELCKKTFPRQSRIYKYNNLTICRNCKQLFKQNRYTKRPPKR